LWERKVSFPVSEEEQGALSSRGEEFLGASCEKHPLRVSLLSIVNEILWEEE